MNLKNRLSFAAIDCRASLAWQKVVDSLSSGEL